MVSVHEGQCGMCAHFGEHHREDQRLIQVMIKHKASEELKEPCGHPKHAALHLIVTANSGCDGFEPAQVHA